MILTFKKNFIQYKETFHLFIILFNRHAANARVVAVDFYTVHYMENISFNYYLCMNCGDGEDDIESILQPTKTNAHELVFIINIFCFVLMYFFF